MKKYEEYCIIPVLFVIAFFIFILIDFTHTIRVIINLFSIGGDTNNLTSSHFVVLRAPEQFSETKSDGSVASVELSEGQMRELILL